MAFTAKVGLDVPGGSSVQDIFFLLKNTRKRRAKSDDEGISFRDIDDKTVPHQKPRSKN